MMKRGNIRRRIRITAKQQQGQRRCYCYCYCYYYYYYYQSSSTLSSSIHRYRRHCLLLLLLLQWLFVLLVHSIYFICIYYIYNVFQKISFVYQNEHQQPQQQHTFVYIKFHLQYTHHYYSYFPYRTYSRRTGSVTIISNNVNDTYIDIDIDIDMYMDHNKAATTRTRTSTMLLLQLLLSIILDLL